MAQSKQEGGGIQSKGRSRGPQWERLPVRKGRYPYVPPRSGPRKVRGDGFRDRKDNRWEWAKAEAAGICEHWDVQHPDGRHSNIKPSGEKHHKTPVEEFF